MAKRKIKTKAAKNIVQSKKITQEMIVAWAQEEMDNLVDLGFPRDVIPPDIELWEVRMLIAQQLLEKNNYQGLAEIFETDFKDLDFTKEEHELFKQATKIKPSRILNQIFYTILKYINRAQKNRSAQKKWERLGKSL
jgi:regulator of sirC expression with transglutaminase-like and TPR domain